jgi:AmmeMemoRadiSam system protein B/AmmeMemoRadiSam system protein A
MKRITPRAGLPGILNALPACLALAALLLALAAPAASWAKEPAKTPAREAAKAPEAPPQDQAPEVVRKPLLAGLWYPAGQAELSALVQGYLDQARPPDPHGRVLGLVAPHAGYPYSGPTAGWAYKLVAGKPYDTVVVISPSHHIGFPGVSVYDQGGFETPLGTMPLDQDFIARLKRVDPSVEYFPRAHAKEHAVEVHIPFLQTALPRARLVPLVMGDQSPHAAAKLAASLARAVVESRGKAVLLVASSDLSHYHPKAQARAMDEKVRAAIQAMAPKDLQTCLSEGTCEACGGGPILAVMQAAQALGATQGKALALDDSSTVSGNPAEVVGYIAAAFIQPDAPPPPPPGTHPAQPGQPGQSPAQPGGQSPTAKPAQPAAPKTIMPIIPAQPSQPTGQTPAQPKPQGLAPAPAPITRLALAPAPGPRLVPAALPASSRAVFPASASFPSSGPTFSAALFTPEVPAPLFRLAQAAPPKPRPSKSKSPAPTPAPAHAYTSQERAALLAMARDAIQAKLSGRDYAPPQSLSPALTEPRGVFVTLKTGGELRGCIGTVLPRAPLHLSVAAMAQAAAFEDPRFPPLTPREFESATLEISVLSLPVPLADPDQVEVGRHGLILEKGRRLGLLLPQVATEFAWDRRQFLDAVCQKAGFPSGCWKDPETRLSTFTAEVF